MRTAALALLVSLSAAGAEPHRIISTAPSITEILYALGLGSRVVGVTQYCRYPKDASTKPQIGSFLEPDYERMLALRPDLIVVIKNPVGVTARLRQLGMHAEEVDQDSIADIEASIAAIGKWTGRQAQAAQLASGLRAQLDAVKRSVAGRPRRTALFLVGRAPGTLQGMVGAGPGTFIDELMAIAGGANVLAGSPIQYPKVSLEQVLSSNPEVILDMGDYAHAEGKPMEPVSRLLQLWGEYPQLRAVRRHEVKQVGSDVFVRPGPRMGEAARELRAMLGGEPGK